MRFLVKAVIFSVQGILEALPVFLGIQKGESITIHTTILTSSYAFQLLLTLIAVSHSLCHLLTPYMVIH